MVTREKERLRISRRPTMKGREEYGGGENLSSPFSCQHAVLCCAVCAVLWCMSCAVLYVLCCAVCSVLCCMVYAVLYGLCCAVCSVLCCMFCAVLYVLCSCLVSLCSIDFSLSQAPTQISSNCIFQLPN